MFEHILVPVDGSSLSTLALPIAADLAHRYHSTLTVLYVVPALPVIYNESVYGWIDPDTRSRMKAEGQRILDEARIALDFPEARFLCLDASGSRIAQTIVQTAEQQGVSLIVMGSHGRGGLEHLFLGSVVEGVMRRAGIPVLVVRAAQASKSSLSHRDPAHKSLPPEVNA